MERGYKNEGERLQMIAKINKATRKEIVALCERIWRKTPHPKELTSERKIGNYLKNSCEKEVERSCPSEDCNVYSFSKNSLAVGDDPNLNQFPSFFASFILS
jgi:hypothetical protein